MSKPRFSCVLIDEHARDRYLEKGHNTPDETTPQYASEWHSVFSAVQRGLERRWRKGFTADAHFFMEAEPLPTRFILIEISEESILCPELLTIVQDTIRTLNVDYAVCMRTDYTFMKTEEGEPYPLFDIFVEKTRILIYTEDSRLLKLLNVAPVD